MEEFPFRRTTQRVSYNYSSTVQETTFIYLPDDSYDSAIGIRLFPNEEIMKPYNRIVYEFETGFFGMKVLKDYRFK